ncbi:MAG: hypothetical protein Q9175_004493 [Cornicularia normoerica]
MVSNKHPNESNKPTLMNQKPRDPASPSPKSNSSNKATHGSMTSASAGSGQGRGGSWGGSRDANSGNVDSQREAWALQNWLEQGPREEPWRPGSRKA